MGLKKFSKKLQGTLVSFITSTVHTFLRPPIYLIQVLVYILNTLADFFLDKAKTIVQKVILLWIIITTLVVAAVLMYAVFYKAYVPVAEITKPAYLSFSVCSSGLGICSFPSANVSFWNDDGTLQEILGPGQAYSVFALLEVPESPKNRDLGMFIVAVKLFDRNGAITALSERPTMLRYNSLIMRIVNFFGWLPLYFLGFTEQKQTLSVLMFSHLVDDYYHPSVGANVEIRSHGIDIYSCTLRLSAKFTGLKYFLYYWPVTSAMFAFCWNLVIFGSLLGMTMYKRKSTVRSMAVSLDLAKTNTSDKSGYEAAVQDFDNDDDNEEQTSVFTTKTSGTQTAHEVNGDDLEDVNMLLIQEPADFVSVNRDDEIDIDFMTELRQRRIN